MVYKWVSGYRTSVNAQEAGEIMDRLAREGNLTPQALVDEARPEESPLHKGFEWDDARAAEKYRRAQAVTMIRAVVVSESDVSEAGSEEVKVKVFNLPERGTSYESLKTILVDEEKTDSLMARALAELRTYKAKYSQIEKLSKLMLAIDETLKEIGA